VVRGDLGERLAIFPRAAANIGASRVFFLIRFGIFGAERNLGHANHGAKARRRAVADSRGSGADKQVDDGSGNGTRDENGSHGH